MGGQTVVSPSLHEETGERVVVRHAFEEPAHAELRQLRAAVQAVAAAALLAKPAGRRRAAGTTPAWPWPAACWCRGLGRLRLRLPDGRVRRRQERRRGRLCPRRPRHHQEAPGRGQAQGLAVAGRAADRGRRPHRPAGLFLGGPALRVAGGLAPDGSPGKAQACRLRPPDPYRPFPVEALPEPIRRYVQQGAKPSAATGLPGSARPVRRRPP